MKKFEKVTVNSTIQFKVSEEWLERVKLPWFDTDVERVNYIYAAAMSDPERSDIVTDNKELNEAIEEMKALVEKAKDINRENKDVNIRVRVNDDETFTVSVYGEVYKTGLSQRDANRALDSLKAFLAHDNVIKTRMLKRGDMTPQQFAMYHEIFVNNHCYKYINTFTMEGVAYITYVPKNWRDIIARKTAKYECDDEYDED